MTDRRLRSGPSGPDFEGEPGQVLTLVTEKDWEPRDAPSPSGTTQVQQAWNASGNSNLQVVMSAPHTPGMYAITAQLFKRTAATAGTATRVITYSQPIAGAQTLSQAGNALTGTGLIGQASIIVTSDGTVPITIQWQPTGITGSPVIDVYSGAVMVSAGVT